MYPPANGFQLDREGRAILGNMTLGKGTKVDRFGSEYGMLCFMVVVVFGYLQKTKQTKPPRVII